MNNLTMNVEIFGKKIPVEITKDLNEKEESDGVYHIDKKMIQIESTLFNEKYTEILIHEMIHGMCDRLGMDHTNLSPDLEEFFCANIPTMLLENFTIEPKPKCKRKPRK